MKWVFYVLVFVYMCYRAVYGAKIKTINSLAVGPVDYGEYGNYFPPGTVKTIPCIYNNKFQQVEWIDPSGKPVSSQKTSRIFTQKHQTQTLHGGRNPSLLLSITDAWVDDSGEYECRSEGLSEFISLCIIDPLTFVDNLSEVTVDEGRSYTLTCEARGQPEPRLVWYRNEEVISDDCNSTKYKVMTKFNSQGFQGQLTISSIEPGDAGSYTCEAIQEHKDLEDCSITKNLNITLHVNYGPVFEDGNLTTLFANEEDSVDLECEPKAYPLPTFRWFSEVDDGTLVNYPAENVVTSEDKASTKITIVANAVSFGMNYVCRASNAYGSLSKSYIILEKMKPKTPDEVGVVNSTDTQIEVKLTWDSEESRFPVEEVQYQVIKSDGKKWPKENEWKKVKEQSLDLEVKVNIDASFAVVPIEDLEPETDYWIRLRAVNELGFAPWTKPIQASTDAAAKAEEASEIEESKTESDTSDEEETDEARTDSMFYGIFFAGGILVISFLCMLGMRLV